MVSRNKFKVNDDEKNVKMFVGWSMLHCYVFCMEIILGDTER